MRAGMCGAAAQLLEGALGHVETTDGWLDLYAEGYEAAIANALARGETARAGDLIARMKRTAAARGLPRLDALARAFKARLAGTSGSTTPDWQAGWWKSRPTIWREHHAAGILLVQRALAEHRGNDALTILDDLEASARSADRHRQLRQLAVLRAAALHQQGDEIAALAGLVTVLEAAAREDDTQFLVDLGPTVLPLLQRAWSWSREHWPGASGRQVLATAVTTLVRASEALDAPGDLERARARGPRRARFRRT